MTNTDNKSILILGAKSDIGKAIFQKFAKEGYKLILAARKPHLEDLKKEVTDLKIRYNIETTIAEFDLLDFNSHTNFYNSLEIKPEGVIAIAGYLGNQEKAQIDFNEAKIIIDTNYTGYVSILNIISNDFEKRGSGFIIGISSVAGDRGRKSNYYYGSSKAAFSTYLSGLRNRLYSKGIKVLTIKPGFVKTKMIDNMETSTLLTASPKEVADDIYKAFIKGKDIIYTKWFWRYIMMIIRYIPERIFKKLSI